MRTCVRRAGQCGPLAEGAEVHTGEHVVLEVTASAPVRLVVTSVDSAGKPSVLYPLSGRPMEIVAGAPVRLPAEGDDLVLDPNTGQETLMVIASRADLTEVAPDLQDTLAQVEPRRFSRPAPRPTPHSHGGERHEAPTPVASPPTPVTSAPAQPPPPDTQTAGDAVVGGRMRTIPTRGWTVQRSDESDERVGADGDGLIVWRINLQHVR